MTLRSLLFLSFILLPAATAWAQTAMAPPGGSAPFARPVAKSTIDQAKRHSEGDFTDMKRLQVGGQVQEAWDTAGEKDGVFKYRTCADCVYKVRLRERMVSVIELPEGEAIKGKPDVGDPAGFSVEPRGPRRLAVKPIGFGNDTSLVVYGKSGAVYPLYLRSESFNSVNVPDLVIRIEGAIRGGENILPSGSGEEEALPSLGLPGMDGARTAVGEGQARDDFVKDYPFDPDKLRGWGEYELWGSDDTLKPQTVFRDDHFTYIRYSASHWTDLELPTAYVVVDGLDELVNTRVRGATYIVESTRPLIVLKSGQSYLCIRYTGGA